MQQAASQPVTVFEKTAAEFLSIIDLNLTTETCIYFMILFLIDKAPQHHAQPSINHYYGRKHLY